MLRKTLRRGFRTWKALRSHKNRCCFLLDSYVSGSQVVLGNDVRFSAPVRNEGSGMIRIGEKTSLGYSPAPRFGNGEILLQARGTGAKIEIGKHCNFSNNISIVARSTISIGDFCLLGDRLTIIDCDHHDLNPETRRKGHGLTSPIAIGENVRQGSNVTILKGVTIGSDSVISSGAVVTKNIPTRVVADGVPAKVL